MVLLCIQNRYRVTIHHTNIKWRHYFVNHSLFWNFSKVNTISPQKAFYNRTTRFEVVIRYRLNQTGLKLFYFTTTICLLPVCTSQELCMHTRDSRGNVMRREASLKIDILTISVILGIPKLYLRGQKGQTTTTSSCQHHPWKPSCRLCLRSNSIFVVTCMYTWYNESTFYSISPSREQCKNIL